MPLFKLVTGNRSKLREAGRILGFQPASVSVDLPEIQSMSLEEVLRQKALVARTHVEGPFVVEESGLELDSLNGFPGPLVKWMLDAVGPEGVARVARAAGNPVAHARCLLLYRCGEEEIIVGGVCSGSLVLPPRGDSGFGWDSVLMPDGQEQTCAELGDDIKDQLSHRGQAWRALVDRLAPRDSTLLGSLSSDSLPSDSAPSGPGGSSD